MLRFKKLIMGMIVGATLANYVPAVAADYWKEFIRYEMWGQVGELTEYSIEGVKPPKIVYKYLDIGLHGYYNGGDTIYVSNQLRGDQRKATIFHEMVHYVQVQVGGLILPGPASLVCQAEAEAFAETDEWWRSIDKPEKQRGPDWWKAYTYCRQFYQPQSISLAV